MDCNKVLFVLGSIGSGKTFVCERVVQILAKRKDVKEVQLFKEPIEEWSPILSKMYAKDKTEESKKLYHVCMQIASLNNFTRILDKIKSDKKQNKEGVFYIIERCPMEVRSTFIEMHKENLDLSYKHFIEMFESISQDECWSNAVTLLVDTKLELTVERKYKRNRECEKELDRNYLEIIHSKYQEMAKKIEKIQKIVRFNNNNDFFGSQDDYDARLYNAIFNN